MIKLPLAIEESVESFSKLPGVGSKTALRQVMSMMKWSEQDLAIFSESVSKLSEVSTCSSCGVYSDESICSICSSEHRKQSKSMCVIENISDLMAIEKSQTFSGVYHILGGVLNPLAGIGPDQLRINQLKRRVKELGTESILLAINPSVEGDATCSFLKQVLPQNIEIDRIGFGIPIGGSLEFLDPMTISKALENRKALR